MSFERNVWEEQRRSPSSKLADGTLACPACDAPVAPPARPMSPVEQMGCGFCLHEGAVRDFLSLAPPTRPTRVKVSVVQRPARPTSALRSGRGARRSAQ